MSNIKVCVKIHPLSQRDTKSKKEEQWRVTESNSLQCMDPVHSCKFTFDHVIGARSPNYEVYLSIVKPIFESCLIGFNGTILTYGSSLAGKNYTMIGTKLDPGILLTTIEQLFIQIGGSPEHTIRFGYIEIYKEKIYDLLNDRQPVFIDQNKKFDFLLSNDEIIVENYEKAVETVFSGSYKRKSSAEDGSKLSNLSHSIFRITIQSEDKANGKMLISYLRFVHVAGSETISKNSTLDLLQDESNRSLYWFNAVIDELNRGEKNVSFNNSVLTMLLREPLGGKSNTAIICNIRSDVIDETMPALKFVCQVRNVRTFPMRNEMYTMQSRPSCSPVSVHDGQFIDVDHYLKQIANLKIENALLRNELEEEKTAAAVRKQWFREQMKSAEFAQQKLQHDLMEHKRIRRELELTINHLTNSNPNEDQLTDKETVVDPLRQNGYSSVNNGLENLMRESTNYVDNRSNETLHHNNGTTDLATGSPSYAENRPMEPFHHNDGTRNLMTESPKYVDNRSNESFQCNNGIRNLVIQSPEYVDHRSNESFQCDNGIRNLMIQTPEYVDHRSTTDSFQHNDGARNLMIQSPEYVDHRPTEPFHRNDGNRHLMRQSPEYVDNRPNESFDNNNGTRNLMIQSPEYVDHRPTEPFHHNDGTRHLMRQSPEHMDNRPNESFHNNNGTRHWTRESPQYLDNPSTSPFHHNDGTRHLIRGSPKYVNNRPKKAFRHSKGTTNVIRRSPNYVNNRRNGSFHYNNGPRNSMSRSPEYVDNRSTNPYHHNDGNTNLMKGSPNYSVNRSFHNERETGNKRKSRCDSSESDWSETSKTQKCEENDKRADVGPSPSPYSVCERIRNRDKSETCTLTVRNAIIGRIIGPGGSRLNGIRSATGVSISISARNGESARNVTINGNSYAVGKAVDMIKERLENDD